VKLLKEPLVQFLTVGAVLFLLSALLPGDSDATHRIEVDAARIDQLRQVFTVQWRRPPTAAELEGLIAQHIDEEVLYREAMALGLDRDDTIVRRRLAQKMQFLIEDIAVPPAPTEAALESYFEAHRAEFRTAPYLTFTHVYFSADRRPDAEAAARSALALLQGADRGGGQGDPFMLRLDYADVTRDDVARLFGAEFADTLFALEPDGWQGPIRSSYGWHPVRIVSKFTPPEPEFADVRDAVLAAWLDAARRRANSESLDALKRRYDIVVADPGTL
jgi:peptidyl-prolyl cis-trans isomerase C